MEQPAITLHTGARFPLLGLGTWKSKVGEVQRAVVEALRCGYRHIDCAWAYENEQDVGAGLAEAFSSGIVRREDVFVTSKLWNTHHRRHHVREYCMQTLKNLGLSYLDAYLIHWPICFEYGGPAFPQDEQGNMKIDKEPTLQETWEAMEALVADGLVKAIGVSNFGVSHLEKLLSFAKIPPAINQCESHPHLQQEKLVEFCCSKNIAFTAYSPLGTPDSRSIFNWTGPTLLEDETLRAIATRHGKTPAQVLIHWAVQRGTVVIPKSVTPSRIRENFDSLTFNLTPEDMAAIKAMERGLRYVQPAWFPVWE